MKILYDILFYGTIVFWIISIIYNNFKLRKNFLTSLKVINDLEKKVVISRQLIDLVASGLCNPVVKSMYSKLCDFNIEEYPKTQKDFAKLMCLINNETFQKLHNLITLQIGKTQNEEEKIYLKNKLKKLMDIKNLSDVIDENSSPQYVQTITQELQKTIQEFNDFHEDNELF